MLPKTQHPKPLYPDVLGAITGGSRISMSQVECALGIFPRQVYLDQPFETALVLQSTIDQPVSLRVTIRLPTADRKGTPVKVETPKPQLSFTLHGGEVGVLRIPMVVRAPTPPGKDYQVQVAIQTRAPANATVIRPPGRGVPPSVLAISPFKLQVLKEIAFTQVRGSSADILLASFDVAPRAIPNPPPLPRGQYEILWKQEQMGQEITQANAYVKEARKLVDASQHGSSYHSFHEVIEERFAARDLPLHDGEIMAIAKILAYTVDDAPRLEQNLVLEETRWFRALCQVLAHNPNLLAMDRHDLIAHHIFDAVVYDAILLSFSILESKVTENLGDKQERLAYANRVLGWLGGDGEADLSYVYLPLVMAGLSISRLVRHSVMESPWDIVDALTEATRGRIRLAAGDKIVVFQMLNDMLAKISNTLRQQRVDRP